VDNLPAELLPQFARLCRAARGRYEKAVIVMDVRGLREPDKLSGILEALSAPDMTVRILYLEASPGSILRRYKESRRPHPLEGPGEPLREAMEREAILLQPLRERADLIIDTTELSLNQLKTKLRSLLLEPGEQAFSVSVISFGYKNDLPPEADLVFDVRCLPNPYYLERLRDLTGLHAPVRDYVFQDPAAGQLLEKLRELLAFLIPLYEKDRTGLTVAVGCTGGRHRSVAVAQALADELARFPGIAVSVLHRDMER
ncbi:MAG: RNase adapter RapZ, partial [Oscillospiraceae bacterium]|nr:RNase adapter RapZ [Oscillospiraceae bacterium]